MYAVATGDVLMANSNDVNLAKTPLYSTGMTMKSSSRFDKINNLDRDYSYWQIISHVCPRKYHVTAFISSILGRVQGWRVSRIRCIPYWWHSPPRLEDNTSYWISDGLGVNCWWQTGLLWAHVSCVQESKFAGWSRQMRYSIKLIPIQAKLQLHKAAVLLHLTHHDILRV